MSNPQLHLRQGRHRDRDKALRPGRSVLLATALGLALSASLASPVWAGTDSAPGQNKDRGQPCAGCVGNADDKSPSGQEVDGFLDGSDPNAGYECDTNKGVGRGNPAHSGCNNT